MLRHLVALVVLFPFAALAQNWTEHVTKEEGFRVEFPDKPEVDKSIDPIPIVSVHVEYEGRFFIVMFFPPLKAKDGTEPDLRDPELSLNFFSKHLGEEHKVRFQERRVVSGHPALYIVYQKTELGKLLQVVELWVPRGNTLYRVSTTGAPDDEIDVTIKRFIESFALLEQQGSIEQILRNSLRDELKGSVTMNRYDGALAVTISFAEMFEADSDQLQPRARDILNIIGRELTRPEAKGRVRVTVHTDWDPATPRDTPDNLMLTQKRAGHVVDIVTSLGNDPGRFEAVGRGDTEPVVLNVSPERHRNRRIEITLQGEAQ